MGKRTRTHTVESAIDSISDDVSQIPLDRVLRLEIELSEEYGDALNRRAVAKKTTPDAYAKKILQDALQGYVTKGTGA